MKMIYQAGLAPEPPHHPMDDADVARLLHDSMRHGQAVADEVMAEVERRLRDDVKFNALVKMAEGILDLRDRLDPDEQRYVRLAAAIALVVAGRVDPAEQLQRVLDGLRQAEIAARTEAARQGIPAELALSAGGEPILAPILTAQAQVLTALADLRQDREKRDRELLARHFRSLASAESIEDWPGYIRDVAEGHLAGTSWYRP